MNGRNSDRVLRTVGFFPVSPVRSFVTLHLTYPSSSSTPGGLRGNRGGEVKGNGTGPTR